jgi:hypothetical protein
MGLSFLDRLACVLESRGLREAGFPRTSLSAFRSKISGTAGILYLHF